MPLGKVAPVGGISEVRPAHLSQSVISRPKSACQSVRRLPCDGRCQGECISPKCIGVAIQRPHPYARDASVLINVRNGPLRKSEEISEIGLRHIQRSPGVSNHFSGRTLHGNYGTVKY